MSIINIDIQKPEIPVRIGGLDFVYSYKDKNLFKEQEHFQKVVEKANSLTDDTNENELKVVLRGGYDMLLGKGAFDQIYPLSESCYDLAVHLFTLRTAIEEELEKRGQRIAATQKEKAQKYLQNKKK